MDLHEDVLEQVVAVLSDDTAARQVGVHGCLIASHQLSERLAIAVAMTLEEPVLIGRVEVSRASWTTHYRGLLSLE